MSSLLDPPPLPARAEALLQILDSVLAPKCCAYVAGPLNSGRAYYERIASGDISPSVRADNQERLSEIVSALRKRLAYPIFDSGLLRIPDWSGRDYSVFFIEVIRRYARECWFLNGWEFSSGATKEFVFCCSIETPCFTESGGPLSIAEGRRLIGIAANFVHGLKLDDTKLRSREADLMLIGSLDTARLG